MDRKTVLAALFFAAGLGLACGCNTKPKVIMLPHGQKPPPLRQLAYQESPYVKSIDGVAHFSLAAMDSDERVPVLLYGGGYLAPTIEVNAGDQVQIAFTNRLGRRGIYLASGHDDQSNLHFHGLTSSPDLPQDDSLFTVAPGYSFEYVVDVNPGQPPGLYWYHPHPHGEAAWQVGSGMSGAIIIDGIQNVVPEVAGLRERVLIVRQAGSENERNERIVAGRRYCGLQRMKPAARAAFLAKLAHAKPSPAASPSSALTVNNLPAKAIKVGIAPGEREFFRVVNATGSRNLDLSIGTQKLELVAEDGVPLAYLPGSPRVLRLSHIVIPPAGRAEFIVTGPPSAAVMRTAAYDTGPKGDSNPSGDVLKLVDDGGGTAADRRVPPVAHAPVKLPSSFYRVPMPAPRTERIVRLEEKADGTDFRINGSSYAMNDKPMFTAKAGTIERWTLLNGTDEIHDFHIHQVHFVVESINGIAVPKTDRHWLDEVNVPYRRRHHDGSATPGKVVLLVDFRDPVIRGNFLFHCHILDHEYGGMMAKLRVI